MRADDQPEGAAVARHAGTVRRSLRWVVPTAALAVMIAVVLMIPPGAGQTSDDDRNSRVTLCHVPTETPRWERTLEVAAEAADRMIARSLSYFGPCASYGESAKLGGGTLTAYSQLRGATPVAIGLVFTADTLDGLPYDPPTAGLWCLDRDDDGDTDGHHECAGGYERALHLSSEFRSRVDIPFTYVLVNWNPHGHVPPGVFDVPHFDVHFYVNENSERLDIRPGPCPELVNCEDYEVGKVLPKPKYVAPDYEDVDALEPAMGNHLVDRTNPAFHGEPFTHTFIYGSWDGHITFYEPMVTHDWYSGLRDGVIDDHCFPLKLPKAWERTGWYPTRYCMRYRNNRDELTTSLEGFVRRRAS